VTEAKTVKAEARVKVIFTLENNSQISYEFEAVVTSLEYFAGEITMAMVPLKKYDDLCRQIFLKEEVK